MKKISLAVLLVSLMTVFSACGGGGGGGGTDDGPNITNKGKLPDTGQTTCYDPSGVMNCAGSGQDGAYSINPPSYTDNGDGTIRDNVTGLTWQKCTVGLSGADCGTGSATPYNWFQASGTYDATYNDSTTNVCGSMTIAGGGWRLPTRMELLTLVNYGTNNPAIDTEYFPATQSWDYWSSSTYAGNINSASWMVGFVAGGTLNLANTETGFVRCVR